MRRPHGLVGSNPTPSRAFGFGSRFLIPLRCWDDCWEVRRLSAAYPHVLQRPLPLDLRLRLDLPAAHLTPAI